MSKWSAAQPGVAQRLAGGDDDTFVVETVQDVEPILDWNQRARNASDGYNSDRSMKHIARIPVIVAKMWRTMYGVDVLNPAHADKVRALLNDSEWSKLRTSDGQFGGLLD